jgi:hypothetical protein
VKLKQGDLADEMTLITGAQRSALVDVETGMVLLEMKGNKFDAFC